MTSRVYLHIRQEVLSGSLKPGARLKIDDLRQMCGTGASPIREALSLLTAEGLVERIDQRGFRVAEASLEEFEDLVKARIWLETAALRESVELGDQAWEERLVIVSHRLSRTPRNDPDTGFTRREWETLHKAFHMALVDACGSRTLLRVLSDLFDRNVRYRRIGNDVRRDVTEEHRAIVEAALARDPDLAVARLTAHYRRTGDLLTAGLGGAVAPGCAASRRDAPTAQKP